MRPIAAATYTLYSAQLYKQHPQLNIMLVFSVVYRPCTALTQHAQSLCSAYTIKFFYFAEHYCAIY